LDSETNKKGGVKDGMMNFDFTKHKICATGEAWGEGAYVFFNCAVCGLRWERCDRTYVIEGESVLGQCCPECFLSLVNQGAAYEVWEEAAGSA
jgi:hypothetical protein